MVIGLLLPLQLGDYSGVMDAYGIGITEFKSWQIMSSLG